MFNSRNLNNRINRILERALRLFYWNNLSFSELLELDNSVAVRQKNLQVLVTEIDKVKNGMTPEIMKDSFKLRNPSCNLRSSSIQFGRENVWFMFVRYTCPKLLELVPNNIEYCNLLSKFKKLIKSWKPDACPCRLCKIYIALVGFI